MVKNLDVLLKQERIAGKIEMLEEQIKREEEDLVRLTKKINRFVEKYA